MNGYANALTFGEITDEIIAQIETFISTEMFDYLKRTAANAMNEKDESCFTDDDDVLITNDQLIDYFGKVYATNTSQFQFLSGEIVLIKALVKYVKGKVGPEQKKGLKLFKTNRSKKSNKLSTKTSLSESNVEKLTSELIQRVIECMRSYGADCFFDTEMDCVIHDKIVDVRIKKGVGVYGTVSCEICSAENKKKNKPKRVYYNDNSEWPCWILSNFTKHLKNVHHLKSCDSKTRKSKPASVSSLVEQVESAKEERKEPNRFDRSVTMEEVEVVVVKEEDVDDSYTEVICSTTQVQTDSTISMFTQLSDQINIMMQATLENSESREDMGFMVNKTMQTIDVAKTYRDGNCLFSSLAHQLFHEKISSKSHRNKTRLLRNAVVNHILEPKNFPKFMHDIKDRVYDIKKKDEITNMEAECKLWVRYCLGKDRTWGGTETIYAIAELEKVNIIIFNEHGEPYILRNMTLYDRTICIAYRLPRDENGKIIPGASHFHYDSMCDLKSTTLSDVAKHIESRLK